MGQSQKFTIEERVLWGDVDAARIIFYGSYIRFFEIAETELFRAAGIPYGKVFDELDIWLPRVHLECDFKRAAQLDDLLEVSVYVAKFGRTSLRLNFEVRRKCDDGRLEEDLIATAHFVLEFATNPLLTATVWLSDGAVERVVQLLSAKSV